MGTGAYAECMTSAQSKYGGAKVVFPPPFVFLGLSVIGAVAHRLEPLELPLGFWWCAAIGALVAGAGLYMVLSARVRFVRSGQDPAPWRPTPVLLVEGIYGRTRNPMYLGITLFQLGLGIALGNGWIAALAPLGLAIVHVLAVRAEEAYLEERFGESYLHYTASVRRYL